MYNQFYKFSERPFELTPDPKFFFMTHGIREIIASLIYGIQQRRGFITVIGQPGTGKTTLLNAALDKLNQKTVKCSLIQNTGLSFKDTLQEVLFKLGLVYMEEKLTKSKMIQRLNNFAIEQFEKGANVAIILDEAQRFSQSNLENLRLISNLETRKQKLIQLVLSGQMQLETNLKKPSLTQLAQRISIKARTRPFDERDTYEYIQHRLEVAEYDGPPLFSNKAKQLIWTHSQGIPRNINTLCDSALLIGYAVEKKRIDSSILTEAIDDLSWEPLKEPSETSEDYLESKQTTQPANKRSYRKIVKIAGVIAMVCLLIAGFLFYKTYQNQWIDIIDCIRSR